MVYTREILVSFQLFLLTIDYPSSTCARVFLHAKRRLTQLSFHCRFVVHDKETFFTVAQRSLIVHELLLRTRYEEEKDKFGKVFFTAYGFHECPCSLAFAHIYFSSASFASITRPVLRKSSVHFVAESYPQFTIVGWSRICLVSIILCHSISFPQPAHSYSLQCVISGQWLHHFLQPDGCRDFW